MLTLLRTLALITLCSAPAFAGSVSMSSSDGTKIHAQAEGAGKIGVLLLHGEGRSHEDFANLQQAVAAGGMMSMSLDLRGHGETGGTADEAAYAAMQGDVTQAVSWLEKKGAESVVIIGAEFGSVLALNAAAASPSVKAVGLVEPRLSGNGYKVTTALNTYGNRPLMMVVGESDSSGMRAASAMESRALGTVTKQVISRGQSYREMSASSMQVDADIINWVIQTVREAPEAAQEAQTATLDMGDEELQTSGKKFGEE